MSDESRNTSPEQDASEIRGGIEFFTVAGLRGEQCARCGSSAFHDICEGCGGDGVVEDDSDWEDPDVIRTCEECEGKGGWWYCSSGYEWCVANPLPDRGHIETTAKKHEVA